MSLNPAISLLSAIVFSLLLSFSNLEIIFFIPVIFLIFLNLKYILKILKKLLLLNFFIVFLVLFFYFETDFNQAINLFFKINLIILFNLLLFSSSNGFDIVKGFMMLRFPQKFISALYFTVKLIFELNRILMKVFLVYLWRFWMVILGIVLTLIFFFPVYILSFRKEHSKSLAIASSQTSCFCLSFFFIILL